MNEADIKDAIVEAAANLKGSFLYYLAGKKSKGEDRAKIMVIDVGETSIKCDRSGEEISISMTSVQRLASALSAGQPIHVDTVFGGSGNVRTPLETIAAHAPFCGYLPADSEYNDGPKKLIWFPDAIHAVGEVMDATAILRERQNHAASSGAGRPSTPLIRSLLAKPFLILTGPSGTGKTRGAVRLAEELCGDGGRWVVVAVGADWTDNRHVVGYLNPLERDGEVAVYESTAVLELVMRANEHPDEVHALILDEMNLSHVERYFADFLSAMELADGLGALRLHGAGRARTRVGREVAGSVDFPGNLLVIGTVNIDETTYMFSPKVLDRANVVEMEADGEGLRRVLLGDGEGDDGVGGGEDRGVAFLEVARVIRGGREDVVVPSLPEGVRAGVVARLLELHRILARGRGEFGYRTGKEVMAYLRASYFLTAAGERTVWETGGWEAALDEQILQKILPKLHGSRSRLGPLLGALARYCASGSEEEAMKHYPAGGRSAVYGLQDVRALEGAKFGRSYRKLARMIEVLVEEQFVSFIC